MPRLNLTEAERQERLREQSRKATAKYRATPKGKVLKYCKFTFYRLLK